MVHPPGVAVAVGVGTGVAVGVGVGVSVGARRGLECVGKMIGDIASVDDPRPGSNQFESSVAIGIAVPFEFDIGEFSKPTGDEQSVGDGRARHVIVKLGELVGSRGILR